MHLSSAVKKFICAVLMITIGALALRWWGWSLWTAFVVAVALACPIVMLYAWYLSRRAESAVQSAEESLRRSRGERP
jgi:Flp pilus assembly protein TadB